MVPQNREEGIAQVRIHTIVRVRVARMVQFAFVGFMPRFNQTDNVG